MTLARVSTRRVVTVAILSMIAVSVCSLVLLLIAARPLGGRFVSIEEYRTYMGKFSIAEPTDPRGPAAEFLTEFIFDVPLGLDIDNYVDCSKYPDWCNFYRSKSALPAGKSTDYVVADDIVLTSYGTGYAFELKSSTFVRLNFLSKKKYIGGDLHGGPPFYMDSTFRIIPNMGGRIRNPTNFERIQWTIIEYFRWLQ